MYPWFNLYRPNATMQMMNELARYNSVRRAEIEAFRDKHMAAHHSRSLPRLADYPLPSLKRRIADALSARWGQGRLEPRLDLIEREAFGGDLALTLPQLLADGGPRGFIHQHLPWVLEVLESETLADVIVEVQTKGMYVNITLSDRWILESAQTVADLGSEFGTSGAQGNRVFLVDYSSPNVAKTLHAGHIRSTIIGHVLSNLHEACGALVYRINHINDFGGFGFTLEGYRRFNSQFPETMSDSERLVEIYRIRRTLERLLENGRSSQELDALDQDDRDLVARYFPDAAGWEDLKAAYQDLVSASDARFAALEAGDAEEVDLWARMVRWGLADFEHFYDSLNIHIDLVMGESFYFHAGDELIAECLGNGTAVLYTASEAEPDLAELDASLAQGLVTPAEHERQAEAIRKDIGAVVVRLGARERMVVRRADGLSIYATRDLGAIRLRSRLFEPTDMTYVVGQEQRIHFSRLFRAAYAMRLASLEKLRFEHVYFGFYVDAQTGRKLSSRSTVAGVNQLLASSIQHFRAKSAERGDLTEADLEVTAKQLAVGSLIFNDLKQDVKGPVEIDTADLEATIAGFEKSGGAYVVYTACRARGILRKHGQAPPRVDQIADIALDGQEANLLLRIQQMPERLLAAAEEANPTILIRHLLEISWIYNPYYVRVPVISQGVADPVRLVITKAVEQSLTNGLRICHVECPEKI